MLEESKNSLCTNPEKVRVAVMDFDGSKTIITCDKIKIAAPMAKEAKMIDHQQIIRSTMAILEIGCNDGDGKKVGAPAAIIVAHRVLAQAIEDHERWIKDRDDDDDDDDDVGDWFSDDPSEAISPTHIWHNGVMCS